MPNQNTVRYPGDAFDDAIKTGALAGIPSAPNFAGLYMYMHTDQDGVDWFKHIDTRQYIRGDQPFRHE